jgi:hypothetical protein
MGGILPGSSFRSEVTCIYYTIISTPLGYKSKNTHDNDIQSHPDMLSENGSGFMGAESGPVSACTMSLKTDASSELKDQVIQTILWKE